MYDNMCAHAITDISFITSMSDLLFPETKILSELRSRTEKLLYRWENFKLYGK